MYHYSLLTACRLSSYDQPLVMLLLLLQLDPEGGELDEWGGGGGGQELGERADQSELYIVTSYGFVLRWTPV